MTEYIIEATNRNGLLYEDYLIVKADDTIDIKTVKMLAEFYFHDYYYHIVEKYTENYCVRHQEENANNCIFPIAKIEYEKFKEYALYLKSFLDDKKILENKIADYSKLLPRASRGSRFSK